MSKSKMTFIIVGCIGVFLIATFVLLPVANAGEVTVKMKITGYLTKVEVVSVPDVEKHAVGVYERRGVAVSENGETAEPTTPGVRLTIPRDRARLGGTPSLALLTVPSIYQSTKVPRRCQPAKSFLQ